MPYYLDQRVGTSLSALQDFTPTGAQAFSAQVGESWEANPSVLAFDAGRVALANRRGERLSAYDAGQIATQSGLRDFAPGEGEYTREALDIVIERKREQRMRQDVIARTPWSAGGTPVRALGMLAANLLDPANIATAYVPVIGQARYAALLRGAAGAGGRAAVRAGVGAAEGAVGAALVEPAIVAGRRYLDDDYTMSDSLLNVAFGGALGGGLHVVGGAIGDALAPGRWSSVRTLDDAVTGADLPRPRTDRGEPAPGSAADIASSSTPETRNAALSTAVAHMAEGKLVEVEPIYGYHGTRAQFTDFGVTNDFGYHFAATQNIAEGFAMRDSGTDGRIISAALDVRKALELPDLAGWFPTKVADAMVEKGAAPADFNARVWAAMEKAGADEWAKAPDEVQALRTPSVKTKEQQETLSAWTSRVLDVSNRAGYAEIRQELTRGGYDAVRYRNTLDSTTPSESFIVWDNAKIRQLASGEPLTPDQMRAAAQRQASPESAATVDFAASRAADERLAAAPKREDVAAATEMAEAAVERVRAARADLEARGGTPAQLKALDDAMAEADAGIKDAEALGKAVRAAAVCGMRAL